MRYLFIPFLLLISVAGYASHPLRIGVISDMHYLSEQLMDNGIAVNQYTQTTARNVVDEPAILNKVIDDYLKSDIKIVLISGDITKDGARQSHLDFVNKLKPLINKGVRIYLIPGNHDVSVPNPLRYVGDKTYRVANVSPSEFAQIYADCGYKKALYRDSASLSYVAELDAKTWLLAIDDCLYKESTTNTISAGRINSHTQKWIEAKLDEAKRKTKLVIGMMHHGLVEHIMYQSEFFPQYLTANWKQQATLFADRGMKAIFTGHFHANDITAFTTITGNKIFDIETGALTCYPFAYRFISLTPEGMDIKTRNVTSVPGNQKLVEQSKADLSEVVQKLIRQNVQKYPFIPKETSDALVKLLTHVFLLHVAGDEKVDDELIKDMKAFDPESTTMESSSFKLDFPPADNNVKLLFDK